MHGRWDLSPPTRGQICSGSVESEALDHQEVSDSAFDMTTVVVPSQWEEVAGVQGWVPSCTPRRTPTPPPLPAHAALPNTQTQPPPSG